MQKGLDIIIENGRFEVSQSRTKQPYIKQTELVYDTKTGNPEVGLATYKLPERIKHLVHIATVSKMPIDFELRFKFAQNHNYRSLKFPILPCEAAQKAEELWGESANTSVNEETLADKYVTFIKATLLEDFNRTMMSSYGVNQDKLRFIKSMNIFKGQDFDVPQEAYSRTKYDAPVTMDDGELRKGQLKVVEQFASAIFDKNKPCNIVVYINSTPVVFTTPTGSKEEYIKQMKEQLKATKFVTFDAVNEFGSYMDARTSTISGPEMA